MISKSLLAGTMAPEWGGALFAPAVNYSTGSDTPQSVAIGDFNRDGHPDLAGASSSGVFIYLNNGDGTLQGGAGPYGTGAQPLALAIADLNGDGILDLAVANSASNTVSILLGNGDGSFQTKADFATGRVPTSVAIADLNGDGKPDLAVTNYADNTVSVLLGTGTGGFGSKTDFATGSNPYSVGIGDLNGDGRLDLIAANNSVGGSVSVLLGNGDGTFHGKVDYPAGVHSRSVAIRDLNGDGIPDLAVADQGDNTGTVDGVSVLLGNGDGTFRARVFYPLFDPGFIAADDLNGDGIPDLAVASIGSIGLYFLLGNGDGTFRDGGGAITGETPKSIAIADLNGDGRLDLVVANVVDHTISVVLGIPDTPPRLNPISDMTVNEGETADEAISGPDPDGQLVTFSLVSGPTYASAMTTAAYAATGNIHLAPGFSDAGTALARVRATDTGGLFDEKSLTITVNNVNRAPSLNQPANMSVAQGATADQVITGSDPDGDALTFSSAPGPTFMTVTTTNATTGNIHLAAGTLEPARPYGATVRATDTGGLIGYKSITITVTGTNHGPVLAPPADMTVSEGATADQVLNATDPDGDPLAFTLVSGPTYATVTTTSPGTGTATGNLHLAPGFSDAGVYGVTVTASDGSLSDSKSLTVTVIHADRPPVLAAIANQTVAEGATADVAVSATDPDGDVVTLSASPPSFATLTSAPAAGSVSGNVHIAPNFGDAAGSPYSATVTASSGSPVLTSTRNLTVTVTRTNRPPVLAQPADMTVNEGAIADQVLNATDPDGDPLTFSLVTGPTYMTVTTTSSGTGTATGNLHLAPGFSDAGAYSGNRFSVTDGFATVNSNPFTITVNNTNRPPSVLTPLSVTTFEGSLVVFSVSATDPDGDPVTLAVLGLPIGATFIDNGGGAGSFSWTPGYSQAGSYTVSFLARDSQGASSAPRGVSIVVSDLNRAPVSSPGGPYSGVVNVPLTFNGTGSSDPDGTPLTYLWDFGDAATAVGATPLHAYTTGGTFAVTLAVSDGLLSNSASSIATIQDILPARAFTTSGNRKIRFGLDRAWCAEIEPMNGSYVNTAVVTGTITMSYGARQVPAIAGRTAVGADKDRNGIQELTACFSKADLRTLFAGFPKGTNTVTVTLEGDLSTGGKFRATLTIDVVSTGGVLAASVSPNPLNPEGTLSFTISKSGPVRISVYDLEGRLIRALLDDPYVEAGSHDLRIDGQSAEGARLASAVYFYRIEAPEGVTTGRFAVMK